jgi:hypothetical protein
MKNNYVPHLERENRYYFSQRTMEEKQKSDIARRREGEILTKLA